MIIHTVAKGDTIYSISKQYSIPESRIITDNFLNPTKTLAVGQTLIISRPSKIFSVRGGDTLASVAEKNGVSVLSLLQNNPHILSSGLFPSQTLNIKYDKDSLESIIVSAYTGSASRSSIESKLPYISMLHIQNAAYIHDGEINVLKNTEPIVSLAKQYKALPILSLDCTNESGKFNSEYLLAASNSPVSAEKFINSALNAIKSYGFSGIEIQMCSHDNSDRYRIYEMILALSGIIKEHGYLFFVPFLPEIDNADTAEVFGDIADFVPLWNYIWDDEANDSPASPINKITDALDEAAAINLTSKALLGIPTFGVEYSHSANINSKRITDASEGLRVTQNHHVSSEFDETAKTPFVRYSDRMRSGGIIKTLHYEDARSFSDKLDLINAYGLRGVNVMSLDYDAPVFWQILNQRFRIAKY